jgi:xylose isomerase
MTGEFRFSFGPWNIHEGADPFGPPVRASFSFEEKLAFYKELRFDGIQFHDDDAVPNLNDLSPAQIEQAARDMRKQIDNAGLVAEFVAPRLWEDHRTIDGGYTANDSGDRAYAWDRSKRAIDIANALGSDRIVLWLAREGTYMREAKDAKVAVEQIVQAINMMLEYDETVRILIEPKPNEPMDQAYVPTIGHAVGLASLTVAPGRVGVLVESAHAILAGLDPSDEMAYALAHGKLWSVHLNDQSGLKFDEDKTFGSVDIRRAFNQVRVLDRNGYGKHGEFVGLDVKAVRTQRKAASIKHLRNSRLIFLRLAELVRSLDQARVEELVADRDYEELDLLIVRHLAGSQSSPGPT